jgi:Uma2 family endonuclease
MSQAAPTHAHQQAAWLAVPEQADSPNRPFGLADLQTFPLEEGYRYEIIKGELIVTPAPGRPHGVVAGQLAKILHRVLEQHKPGWSLMIQPINLERETEAGTYHCEPDLSIFDQPDAAVIANETLFPIIVIEVVSPSNPENDYIRKVEAYASLRIPEYWIVDPGNRKIIYLALPLHPSSSPYQPIPHSQLLPELSLDPATLFAALM